MDENRVRYAGHKLIIFVYVRQYVQEAQSYYQRYHPPSSGIEKDLIASIAILSVPSSRLYRGKFVRLISCFS